MSTNLSRRRLIKSAGMVVALMPLVAATREAHAGPNPAKRAELKYQDVPLDGKSCVSCLEFVPGKTEQDVGRCKVIPGDDEISPNGYCILWNTL